MVRSLIRKRPEHRYTAQMMHLSRPHDRRIIPDGPAQWGWIRKIIHMVSVKRIPKADLHLYSAKERLPLTIREEKHKRQEKHKAEAEKREADQKKAIEIYVERMKSLGKEVSYLEVLRAVAQPKKEVKKIIAPPKEFFWPQERREKLQYYRKLERLQRE
eukprot:CAMPEP_0184701610 /NCGR_PEP_ID=MMETSP0313-20130426/20665_1 /TAXON_ID=2792 /ORGANISM="Porphyridium aerugineum, Strain SAG 1380-2" /LENGTH=158 /DNA_ID=CAMNT_0027161735 /DNA_START=18 /DNA_END=491 /DNA_ORIENTATION=-